MPATEEHPTEDVDLSSLRIELVDDSSYARDVLSDVRSMLFELASSMEESDHSFGTYPEEIRVAQHALQTVKERLEKAHENAFALHKAHKEE